jgi:hypothetical protein
LKYHNFFEKKEVEYRNKILLNFRHKKIQNIKFKENNEIRAKTNNTYDTIKEINEEDSINSHPNIIKIIL